LVPCAGVKVDSRALVRWARSRGCRCDRRWESRRPGGVATRPPAIVSALDGIGAQLLAHVLEQDLLLLGDGGALPAGPRVARRGAAADIGELPREAGREIEREGVVVAHEVERASIRARCAARIRWRSSSVMRRSVTRPLHPI
jgi:hypothetical protein